MTNIIMVLGAPNSPEGELSGMAVGRLETGLELYRHLTDCKFVLTGGFGAHFNLSDKPAAYYMSRFLIGHGVPPGDILPFVLSSNTEEDVLFAKEILSAVDVGALYVVTSSFHMPRARFILERVFQGNQLFFVESPNRVSDAELRRLLRHEDEALIKLRKKEGRT